MQTAQPTARWLDFTGMALSSACAIQCATMPFILAALPLLSGGFFADEKFEWLMIGFVATIATTSLSLGFREHRHLQPFMLLVVGLLTLIATRFFFEEETPISLALLALGGFTIAIAHWRNHLHTCRCRECMS